jgi:HEAT repeat protein
MSDMTSPSPVAKLAAYGDPREARDPWPNYLDLGLGPEHVPDLIQLVKDWRAHWNPDDDDDAEDDPTCPWASHIHAWRALGQLRAVEAVEPLLDVMTDLESIDDDWSPAELPDVFALIGPAALPALEAFISDPAHNVYSNAAAAVGIRRIAECNPETRDACIAALIRQLERFEQNDEALNAFILCDLLRLKATQAAPVIRLAFKANRIDEEIVDNWEDVRRELGLEPSPDDPPARPRTPVGRYDPWLGSSLVGGSVDKKQLRAQRKRERKARKQNRKRR